MIIKEDLGIKTYICSNSPLSLYFFKLKNDVDIFTFMKDLCLFLHAKINLKNLTVKKTIKNKETTILRFKPYLKKETNEIFIEFDRLEGCAFLARVIFLKCQKKFFFYLNLDGKKEEDIDKELKMAKTKLDFWINPPSLMLEKDDITKVG